MKPNLRISFSILGLVLALCAHSAEKKPLGDWRLVQENGSFYAQSRKLDLKLRLHLDSGPPQLLRWKSEANGNHRRIGLLIYSSGVIEDHSKKTEVHRAFIIHKRKKKNLGEAPIKYIPQEKGRTVFSPRWEWEKDRVKVTDISYNDKLTFVLD